MVPVIITKEFRFEAAHYLPNMPEGHKCRRMHGHSFKIGVKVKGQPDAFSGIVMDFAEIKAIVKPLIEMLDHYVINEVGTENNSPLLQNPTSENLAKWFFESLKEKLPGLYSIEVYETCTSYCEYIP
ncbi:MAG: 6-carboxytetrahydropterin synthase QueD [Bacteroidia bacterium]|nr:6-carboxytetrahydropterin synthase QueD [Bacteroidia bacterium]